MGKTAMKNAHLPKISTHDGHRWNSRTAMHEGRNCLDCGIPVALFSDNPPCAKATEQGGR